MFIVHRMIRRKLWESAGEPAQMAASSFKAVAAGGSHPYNLGNEEQPACSCGLRTDDTITCWGPGRPSPDGVAWDSAED